MKPPRWIPVLVGGLLLLLASRTAWVVTNTNREGPSRAGAPSSHLETRDGSVATRGGPRKKAKSPFASLPPHLQALVLELHGQVKTMEEDQEVSSAEFVEARGKATHLLEALGLEDLKMLIAYYKNPRSDVDTNDGYDLASHPLFRRWGQLDPVGLRDHIAEELHHGLATLTEPIALGDPFAPSPLGMQVSFDDIASAFAGWATIDPLAAREAWEALRSTLVGHPMIEDAAWFNDQVQRGISKAWSVESPQGSWVYLQENLAEVPSGWIAGFIGGLGNGAPWRSLAEEFQSSSFEKLSDHDTNLVSQWARHEPETALNWILDTNPEKLQEVFDLWHSRSYDGQAFSWLQQNSAGLLENVRLAALRAAVNHRGDRIDELMPLLEALPPSDSTWEFLVDLAHSSPDPFADRLEAGHIRVLVQSFQPPAEIQRQVEAGLADQLR